VTPRGLDGTFHRFPGALNEIRLLNSSGGASAVERIQARLNLTGMMALFASEAADWLERVGRFKPRLPHRV
jgi:hypothetical protein